MNYKSSRGELLDLSGKFPGGEQNPWPGFQCGKSKLPGSMLELLLFLCKFAADIKTTLAENGHLRSGSTYQGGYMEKENERRRFSQAALLDAAIHALSQLTTSPDPRVRTLVLQALGDIQQVRRHTPSRRKNDYKVR